MLRILVIFLALTGCQGPPSPAATTKRCLEMPPRQGPVVARVGDVTITVADVVDRLHAQGSGAARRYSTKKKLRDFVEDQIRLELLARAAIERGLASDPDVVQAARSVMVRKLLLHDLGPAVGGGDVPEKSIVDYYERHKDDYQQPEKRRIAHVQLAPTNDGKALAQNILIKLSTQKAPRNLFRLMAVKHSVDQASRSQGGEIMYKSRIELTDTYGPSFADVVYRLAPGTLGPEPVASTKGWHVVKVVSRREALTRSLDEVREEIREKLLKGQRSKLFDKYLAEIKQRYPVALHEERLEDVLAQMNGARTPESP